MISSRTSTVLIHGLGWLLFFALIISFISRTPGNAGLLTLFSLEYLVFYFIYLFLFYFNGYFLVPEFYLKQKQLYYFLTIALLFVFVWLIKPFDHLITHTSYAGVQLERPPMEIGDDEFREPPGRPRPKAIDIVSIILFFMIWSVSTALQVIRRYRSSEERAARAEADKANAELSFLKAQINPHFLFNTLNNIYAMAITKSEHTAVAVMKLSKIMRYLTDEVGDEFVPLESEIDCITDYIDLQRLRLSKKTTVLFSVSGDPDDKKIVPLLLMTFIENVFKYGTSNHEETTITIQLEVKENTLKLFCRNRISGTDRNNERTGIGIKNTVQRLEHLYPRRHSLHINTEQEIYTVELIINL